MYGKRRISLGADSKVFLNGEGLSMVLGFYRKTSYGNYSARILNKENVFETRLTPDNCVTVMSATKADLRKRIEAIWLQ